MPWDIVDGDSRCPSSEPWAVVKEADGELEGCHATESEAADQVAALNAAEDNSRADRVMDEERAEAETAEDENSHLVDPDMAAIDLDGENVSLRQLGWAADQARVAHQANIHYPLEEISVRKSGKPNSLFNASGRASVTGQSYDLFPGVREQIAPGAFDEVLTTDPDVHALWDHDTRFVLARTRNGTLQLNSGPRGLSYMANVADTSYARDLQHLLERGDIDQASFAFTVAEDGDQWTMTEENGRSVIQRTISRIDQLFDVTITAKGANPFTDASVARSAVRAALEHRSRTVAVRGMRDQGATRESPRPDQPADDEAAASPQQETLADESAESGSVVSEKVEHFKSRLAKSRSEAKLGIRRTERFRE